VNYFSKGKDCRDDNLKDDDRRETRRSGPLALIAVINISKIFAMVEDEGEEGQLQDLEDDRSGRKPAATP